jgi:hypothetical protein
VVGGLDEVRAELSAFAVARRRGRRPVAAAAARAGLLLGLWYGAGSGREERGTRARADSIAREREDSVLRSQPGYVLDSARSIEEALGRFRADIADTPIVLTEGARSRDELVAAFAHAVARGDSVALRRMSMTRAEFAFLVYPSSPYTRPPYRQQPEIAWLLLSAAGDKGLRRLVERRGGKPFRLLDHWCPPNPDSEGENRLWRGCVVQRVRSAADTVTERLFGPILERDGRFKFYSFGNEL